MQLIRDGKTYDLIEVEEKRKHPPASAIMRHLLAGGWIEDRDYSNASYFIRLDRTGNLQGCFKRDDSVAEAWKSWHLCFCDFEMPNWKLIEPRPDLV